MSGMGRAWIRDVTADRDVPTDHLPVTRAVVTGPVGSHTDHRSPVTPFSSHRSRRSPWMWALVAVLAILPYLNVLSADFTFDDDDLIRDNAAVQVEPAIELLGYVYPAGALYRPLTMLTYAANASVSGDPFGYHVVNLALHMLVSLAVCFLALRVLPSPLAAFAAAVLFAVHPIHTEAVSGIVGRAELLAALGVLGMLLAFARALDSAGWRHGLWSALSLAAFAGGVLAKESAVTGLGLLAVLQWWIDRPATLRHQAVRLAPYAAVVMAYVVLRYAVVGALALPEPPNPLDNPLVNADAWTRLRTAVIVLRDYVGLLTVPLHLSADYSFNQVAAATTWNDPRFLLAASLLGGLALATIAAARSAPALAPAVLFAAFSLALTANVFVPIGTIKAERLLYLPSVGWCLACGLLIAALRRRRALCALLIAAIVAVYGTRTWVRNADWRDEATLFSVTMLDAPDSAKAHYNGAVALQRAGRLDEAIGHYRRALQIYADYAAAAYGIGHIHTLQGNDDAALHWYEEALRRAPKLSKAHLQIALLRESRGEYDAAEAALLTGLESAPNDPLLLVNLGAVRLAQGDRWRAGAALARLDRIGTLDVKERALVAEARREIEVALRVERRPGRRRPAGRAGRRRGLVGAWRLRRQSGPDVRLQSLVPRAPSRSGPARLPHVFSQLAHRRPNAARPRLLYRSKGAARVHARRARRSLGGARV
jgi:protein O-mannosyl-transferase